MSETRSHFAIALEAVLAGLPHIVAEEQNAIRPLLRPDPMERVVTAKLLREAVARALEHHSFREGAGMLLVDCLGGSEGARAASALIPVIEEKLHGASLVHLSCATKGRGVARLIERMLRALVPGLPATIDVLSTPSSIEEASEALAAFSPQTDVLVLIAPLGAAGLLTWTSDSVGLGELVRRARVSVLTYPDPESLVAALPTMERELARSSVTAKLSIELYLDTPEGETLLGKATVGPGGDAGQRLWVLLDNARRHRYLAKIVPLRENDEPCGHALYCPCRTLLEHRLIGPGAGVRIIPCGGLLVVVAEGRDTLS
ncbi:MAG: hypothetical protein MUC50_18580 [Myxococcota bacterium]|jgi:hypothetical protein|nr:hypothetical protein [Myxococcota bacterium]